MLQLAATTDKLQLTTSSTAALDVHVSWMDHTLATDVIGAGKQNTAISTATTTDILAAPSAGIVRRVKYITIRNKGAAANTVTFLFDANGTDYELHQETLGPQELLQYTEETGFVINGRSLLPGIGSYEELFANNRDSGSVSTMLIPGSVISLANDLPAKIGTVFRWSGALTRDSGATTNAGSFHIRFGQMPTITGSTTRVTLTMSASTSATDTGHFEIEAIVRGPINNSCIVHGRGAFRHHNATTGLFDLNHNILQAASAGFDITEKDMLVCLSCSANNGIGWTLKSITAEAFNL